MNVLWTYHLIHDSTELADSIWENYVKKSNQIMFQKVRPDAFFVDSPGALKDRISCWHRRVYSGIKRCDTFVKKSTIGSSVGDL
jgi:hypothetical protein